MLQVLGLSHNQLTGTVPSSWASMASLQAAYMDSNQLAGDLPASWAELPALAFM